METYASTAQCTHRYGSRVDLQQLRNNSGTLMASNSKGSLGSTKPSTSLQSTPSHPGNIHPPAVEPAVAPRSAQTTGTGLGPTFHKISTDATTPPTPIPQGLQLPSEIHPYGDSTLQVQTTPRSPRLPQPPHLQPSLTLPVSPQHLQQHLQPQLSPQSQQSPSPNQHIVSVAFSKLLGQDPRHASSSPPSPAAASYKVGVGIEWDTKQKLQPAQPVPPQRVG